MNLPVALSTVTLLIARLLCSVAEVTLPAVKLLASAYMCTLPSIFIWLPATRLLPPLVKSSPVICTLSFSVLAVDTSVRVSVLSLSVPLSHVTSMYSGKVSTSLSIFVTIAESALRFTSICMSLLTAACVSSTTLSGLSPI